MVLPPYDAAAGPPARFAALLDHHVAWHARLGASRYLVYCTSRLTQLLQEPAVQALVASGRLVLVWFDELAQPGAPPADVGDLPADELAGAAAAQDSGDARMMQVRCQRVHPHAPRRRLEWSAGRRAAGGCLVPCPITSKPHREARG